MTSPLRVDDGIQHHDNDLYRVRKRFAVLSRNYD